MTFKDYAEMTNVKYYWRKKISEKNEKTVY